VADLLGLTSWLRAKPHQLSGGMQQRVALGRAIVKAAQLYLMDEPLSNLDAILRVQMRTEIIKLVRSLQATVIYVTHDQVEAMTMADRIAVMKDGTIQQVGTPLEVYNAPANRFVASFIGVPHMNFFEEAELTTVDGAPVIRTPAFSLFLPASLVAQLRVEMAGRKVILGIRPEDIRFTAEEDNTVTGVVDIIEPLGPQSLVFVKCGDTTFSLYADTALQLRIGQNVRVTFNTHKIHIFHPETEQALLNRCQ